MRAVFLDRDGTIIHDGHYLADPAGVRLLDGAAAALRTLAAAGFKLVVVSNQSGLARGIIAPAAHEAVHARFVEVLAAEGVTLDAVYYCAHGPDDDCACRKPRAGMITRYVAEQNIDPAGSFMIGDKPSDIEAGRAAGCRTVFLSDAHDTTADVCARDWPGVLHALDGWI